MSGAHKSRRKKTVDITVSTVFFRLLLWAPDNVYYNVLYNVCYSVVYNVYYNVCVYCVRVTMMTTRLVV